VAAAQDRNGVGRAARLLLLVLLVGAGLAACATTGPSGRVGAGGEGRAHGVDAPYQVDGRWYYPRAQPNYDQTGVASWYGAQFHNRRTADGELFDQNAPSAAHTTLPLPSLVEVTNLANGRRLRVRLNDRGPFVDGRILDLSRAAAVELGFEREGVARVRVRYVGPAPPLAASGVMVAMATPARPAPERPVEVVRVHPPPSIPAAPLVDPPPEAFVAPPPPPAALAGYRVQAGAFQSRDTAERAAARLSDAGATSIQAVQHGGSTLYRVVVSGFADEEAAAQGLVQVLDAGFVGARVIGAD
jgi:rare lipoprotein A